MNPNKSVIFKYNRERAGLSISELAPILEVTARTLYRWENNETKIPKLAFDRVKEMADSANIISFIKTPAFKFIDLFAGIGGIRKAFESVGGECVFTSEWDKACRLTYQENFRCDHDIAGDIREVPVEEIPQHDVLVAGFPCQPFSLAGVSKKNSLGRPHGFRCDTQGTLFFDLAQILEYHKPSVFLLENVKNLRSHDKGRTFEVIKNTLEKELGYYIDWRIIDAKHWLPQHRERIFIAGFRKDTGFTFEDLEVPDISEAPKLNSILHEHYPYEQDEAPYFENGKIGEKYTLTPNLWNYLQAYKEKHQKKGNGFGFSMVGPNDTSRTLSARYYKDGSEILIEQKRKRPRRLTPRECARLMGFDTPGGDPFKLVVSDTQAYKQFGNSVAVPAVTAVAKHMAPHIISLVNESSLQTELPLVKTNSTTQKVAANA